MVRPDESVSSLFMHFYKSVWALDLSCLSFVHMHSYILNKVVFKSFMNLAELFKEAEAVFFMGTFLM